MAAQADHFSAGDSESIELDVLSSASKTSPISEKSMDETNKTEDSNINADSTPAVSSPLNENSSECPRPTTDGDSNITNELQDVSTSRELNDQSDVPCQSSLSTVGKLHTAHDIKDFSIEINDREDLDQEPQSQEAGLETASLGLETQEPTHEVSVDSDGIREVSVSFEDDDQNNVHGEETALSECINKRKGSVLICSICYDPPIVFGLIHCHHVFCLDCITRHRKTSEQCPCCRQRITVIYSSPEYEDVSNMPRIPPAKPSLNIFGRLKRLITLYGPIFCIVVVIIIVIILIAIYGPFADTLVHDSILS